MNEIKRCFFENINKVGKYLAWLSKAKGEKQITRNSKERGDNITKPKNIKTKENIINNFIL